MKTFNSKTPVVKNLIRRFNVAVDLEKKAETGQAIDQAVERQCLLANCIDDLNLSEKEIKEMCKSEKLVNDYFFGIHW